MWFRIIAIDSLKSYKGSRIYGLMLKEISLVDKDIKKFILGKNVEHVIGIDLNKYVQPSSMDIPVGNKAYLVKFKFLPFMKEIKHVIEKVALEELDLDKNPILYKGQTYLIPCLKFNNLPKNYFCRVSPKSSIGRIDLMVRAINDNSFYYDYVENPEGTMWLEVTPQSFNIRLNTGTALSQLKILEKGIGIDLKLKEEEIVFNDNGEIREVETYSDDEIILRMEVPGDDVIGYVARETNSVIDLGKFNEHIRNEFFDEVKTIESSHSKILLEKNKFYILKTRDFIQIPPHLSAEMIPLNNLLGEFRVHYAGFFDPGFGYNMKGNQGILEIRPHENLVIYDGQPICSMKFYKNKSIPEKMYGLAGNNYAKQKGIRLAKYFKD